MKSCFDYSGPAGRESINEDWLILDFLRGLLMRVWITLQFVPNWFLLPTLETRFLTEIRKAFALGISYIAISTPRTN